MPQVTPDPGTRYLGTSLMTLDLQKLFKLSNPGLAVGTYHASPVPSCETLTEVLAVLCSLLLRPPDPLVLPQVLPVCHTCCQGSKLPPP